ncbi:MAG: hypothetical protein AB4040_12335 [Synechococcus sp.]
MNTSNLAGLISLLAILFVSVGDRVLPYPLKNISSESRESISNTIQKVTGKTIDSFPQDSRYSPNRLKNLELD